MFVIVDNKMKRPVAYCAVEPSRLGHPRVQLPRVLQPGPNQLDAAEFEAATKKSPTWQKWIADGDIEVQSAEKGLVSLDPAAAIACVRQTLNVELLETWASEETRPEVKKAIAKRQRELEKRLDKAEKAA